jgi:lipopolysaccharide transport system permease protein
MDSSATPPTSLRALGASLRQHRDLIAQLTRREVIGRYRGSVLGLGWSFFNPLMMLVIYTFVFSVVFKARWGTVEEEGKVVFAIVLFVGLIVHTLFAEVINRAPGLVLGNPNFVKKVVFPLEVLPVISMGTALFHSFASLLVLLLTIFIIHGFLHWTIIFFPLVLFPLVLVSLGISWMLASLGVYLRDLSQIVNLLTVVLMFLSPIFYPVSALPENYRTLMYLNPLTFIIEESRAVLVFGELPDWGGLVLYSFVGLLVVWIGYSWFQKTRGGFADVM